ncbi:MAG TPA: OpgC domain-containing protein [Methylococcus sp.]|nr:OpgC domain-containing protein [Methylococcus sp.]
MNAANYNTNQRLISLDLFRGVALLVIFINHIPFNEWSAFTPSRFGWSDAADIFVFLSGFAAALAYGRSFRDGGLWLGSLRVFSRCGQIYGAHLGLFFLLAMVCALGNTLFAEPDYIHRLNIQYFFDHTHEALPALFTLHYVPNYFDILPMYLVVMLWVPVVCALSRLHVALALAFPLSLYLATWIFDLDLPAHPRNDLTWFFNPFGWQLLFFSGFAFGSGWVRPPEPGRGWIRLCMVFLVLTIPLAHEPTYRSIPWLEEWRGQLQPWLDKSRYGPLRWFHFMALAYLMTSLCKTRQAWLTTRLAGLVAGVGRQSLPMFLLGMTLSYVAGMALDQLGHGIVILMTVNLGGIVLMILAARTYAWLDSKPWKAPLEQGRAATRAVAAALPWGWLQKASVLVFLTPLAISPLAFTTKKPIEEHSAPGLREDDWRGVEAFRTRGFDIRAYPAIDP